MVTEKLAISRFLCYPPLLRRRETPSESQAGSPRQGVSARQGRPARFPKALFWLLGRVAHS